MRLKKGLVLVLFISALGTLRSVAQSLELMPGKERIFVDAQWLKPLDEQYKWTLFSRSRSTVDYEENTDLFMGAYLNYTTKSGLGGTILGRISSFQAGADAGIHYFKKNEKLIFYGLISAELSSELSYSWFSIFRYTPSMNEKWKLYTGIELFTNFNKQGHAFSVQRFRLGLDKNRYQFGFALNLNGSGPSYTDTFTNPGLFIRKEF